VFEAALRPGRIGSLQLPNRIVMGSMHLGIEAESTDGAALAAFYVERARGGAGLIVTGGSAVSRVGAGGRHYSFINEDGDEPKLRRVAAAVHEAGGRIALQLFHAGRYAFQESFGLQPVAPSPIASKFSRAEPRELTDGEIWETIGDFARGAARAKDFGFDAVEVMASEGYLLNQFISPLTNRREDAWGGDAERRMRFGIEVLRAIRRAVGPDFPVIFRISGADLMEGGTPQEEILAYARALAGEGVDALNIGIGWHESSIPTVQAIVPTGIWVRYAAAVKDAVGALPVIASNRINSLDMADRVLAEGRVDFISMARPFLADPLLVAKAIRGEARLVNTCIACNQACIDRSLSDQAVSCMVNPRAARELELREDEAVRAREPRRFAVVGAGPAGMEAARVLAALGHHVELFDAHDGLGGQFRMACRIPGKEDFAETIRYFTNELTRLGVTFHLRRSLGDGDAALLRSFDGVVMATGVHPRRISLPGVDLPHVVSYVDVLQGSATVGERVAVIGGGGIGIDVAHLLSHGDAPISEEARFLYEQGIDHVDGAETLLVTHRRVAVMRRGKPLGEHIGRSTRWAVLKALRLQGVQTYTGIAYERIVSEGVWIVDAQGERKLIEADTVVIAAGQEPNTALRPTLDRVGVPYAVVGGAKEATELNAVRAFEEGARAAHDFATRSSVRFSTHLRSVTW